MGGADRQSGAAEKNLTASAKRKATGTMEDENTLPSEDGHLLLVMSADENGVLVPRKLVVRGA